MIICTCFFTEEAFSLFSRLKVQLPEITWIVRKEAESLKEWAESAFNKHLPLLFISASGIAVRTIAPFVKDKLTDSPVIVMDEKGKFVIPLLSGHAGGANDLSCLIAERMNAENVITTATDVEGKFAADVFARKNGLRIVNKEGIKKVSAKILNKEKITVWINPEIQITDDNIPEDIVLVKQEEKPSYADILIDLCGETEGSACCGITAGSIKDAASVNKGKCLLLLLPKVYCAGMGCKKGRTFEELNQFLTSHFADVDSLYAVASIDLKKDELGLMTTAQYHHVPFFTFSAEELKLAGGSFSESEFVEKTTGVSNVCERAAVLCAGKGADLIMKKRAEKGMTLAIAKRVPVITTWGHSK